MSRTSSSLDSIETSKQMKTYYNSEQEISYHADPDEFRQTHAVLSHLYGFRKHQIINRLEDCGRDSFVYYDQDAAAVVLRSSHCHLRWCPICAAKRARRISGTAYDWLMAAREPAFITLTLAHIPGETLGNMLKRLDLGFKKFRRDKTLRTSLFGGIWFRQVKRGADGHWHAHLHIAADTRFIPQRQLSAIWAAATSNSKIVDIQRVWDKRKVAAYIARYVSKPARLSEFSFSDAVEIVTTLHSKRMFGKWGTASQLQFGEPEEQAQANLIPVCKLSLLASLARSGLSPLAHKLYTAMICRDRIAAAEVEAFKEAVAAEPPT